MERSQKEVYGNAAIMVEILMDELDFEKPSKEPQPTTHSGPPSKSKIRRSKKIPKQNSSSSEV
jgi:hypothetical protein